MGYDPMDYGLEVGGFWGNVWGKFKGAIKAAFKSKAVQGYIGSTLNSVAPGAGTAIAAGMKVISGAKQGDKNAEAQVVALADAAKGGDANAKKVAGMLSVVNKAYNEVAKEKAADAAIGMAAARWSKDSTTKLDW